MRVPALEDPPKDVTEPCQGSPIDLVIEGGWRQSVRTHSDDPSQGDVRLLPVGGPAVIPGEGETIKATLEWRSPRGLVRRQGVLRADQRGFVLADAHEAVVMQRRNFARVRCAVRVNVHGADPAADLITRTVDLSVGGMLVEQAAMLSIDERVAFTLNLPGDAVVHGEGSVVRATQFGHRAIEFDPFPRADEQAVARFVFAQEREGRSAAAYV